MDRGVRPIGDWSMLMILSTWSSPVMRLCAPGPLLGAVQAVGHRLEEHLVDERGLARARHPGDAAEHAERDLHVDAAQVVLRGALDLHVSGRPPAARSGTAISRLPERNCPVAEPGIFITCSGVP